MLERCWQINLQAQFGGGEVYTAFLTRALQQRGVQTTLFVHRDARFWKSLALGADTEVVAVESAEEIAVRLPRERAWLLSHGQLPQRLAADERHLRTAIAHMPPQGRGDTYPRHDLVIGVSAWVLEGLRAQKVPVWQEPLYGVAEVRGERAGALRARSAYNFDKRKLRDRILGWILPPPAALLYEKRSGLTLGIVSRLSTIKQFPQQFAVLAPLIASRPGVNLEIFGAGGYASVRDLRRALAPLGSRARFWGHQANVAAAYAGLDYLMTGLPEKEALGLNIVEAQSCGLPVLAVAAPPFTETVREGETGYLYRDPRADGGADFARLLDELLEGKPRPDPGSAREHLQQFTFEAFVGRVERLLAEVRSRLGG